MVKERDKKELDTKTAEDATKIADILEEIEIEELTVDGICGVY